ncbi:MAG: tRNA epoxyqueuosine(34) reductase QueG [Myxococcota bacterium]
MGANELTREVKGLAQRLGFARAGVARAEPLVPERDRLRAWVAEGRHGEMGWMADTVEVRGDPSHAGMLPGARSVLVLVAPYARPAEGPVGPEPGRVARYARGRDYHNVLGKRARKLARRLREHGHAARASVDSLPVLERAWAQRAGVGFVGKNCCLIVPGLGSHVFLACVVTTAELVADAPMKERCGTCRLCLEACPTEAFTEPRRMDARRCISYLTIERRGEVPEDLRARTGEWLFGCDVCQDVCPYNRTAPEAPETTAPFAPHPRLADTTAADLLRMDDDAFEAWSHGTPLRRPGREGMARNAATVLGNVGGRRHLPVLREAAEHDPSPVVRRTAAWAMARIAKRKSRESPE